MAKPRYAIYIDGTGQDVFKEGVYTTDRTEALEMFESLKYFPSKTGLLLELRVSSRGIESVLKSDTIEEACYVADTDFVYNYKRNSDADSEDVFHTLLKELHEVGFSVPEIAEITARSERTVRYNLQKLAARNQIKLQGKGGRPFGDISRERMPVKIQLYKDSYEFLMHRFGNVTEVVNDLVDRYRKELASSADQAETDVREEKMKIEKRYCILEHNPTNGEWEILPNEMKRDEAIQKFKDRWHHLHPSDKASNYMCLARLAVVVEEGEERIITEDDEAFNVVKAKGWEDAIEDNFSPILERGKYKY